MLNDNLNRGTKISQYIMYNSSTLTPIFITIKLRECSDLKLNKIEYSPSFLFLSFLHTLLFTNSHCVFQPLILLNLYFLFIIYWNLLGIKHYIEYS